MFIGIDWADNHPVYLERSRRFSFLVLGQAQTPSNALLRFLLRCETPNAAQKGRLCQCFFVNGKLMRLTESCRLSLSKSTITQTEQLLSRPFQTLRRESRKFFTFLLP